ncbi:MAG: integrase [Rhodothermales bacterium]|jgi:integrase
MRLSVPYLTRQGKTFYFRISVPADLREQLGCREIKRSLHTGNLDRAAKLAPTLRGFAKQLFREARSMSFTPEEKEEDKKVHEVVRRFAQDWLESDESIRVSRGFSEEQIQADLEWSMRSIALDRHALARGFGSHLIDLGMHVVLNYQLEDEFDLDSRNFRKLCRELTKASMAVHEILVDRVGGNYANAYDHPQIDRLITTTEDSSACSEPPVVTLRELQERYVQEHVSNRSWTEKTKVTVDAVFRVLNEMLGDCPIKSIDYEALRKLRDDVLMRLPPNRGKVKRYRDRSMAEILEMSDVKPMSLASVRKHCIWIASFFKWCYDHNYIDRSPATKLTPPAERKPVSSLRAVFNAADREILGKALQEVPARYPGRPERYWIPLIALFSGMRQNEICQLYIKDVIESDGVWCFDINDIADKRCKSTAAQRLVPIHPSLIALGLLEFVSEQRVAGQQRLWPALKSSRDGYGQAFSRWFGAFLRREVTTDRSKVFHSLRHTFANELKQQGVAEVTIAELVGHENHNITTGRYGKRFAPKVLASAISKIHFAEAVPPD